MTSRRADDHPLRSLLRGVLATWSLVGHAGAVDNARAAATACSRRRLEREEVVRFLADRAVPAAVATVAADGATRVRRSTR